MTAPTPPAQPTPPRRWALWPWNYFRPRDLQPNEFPAVTWDRGTNSLEALRRYVVGESKKAANWYMDKRGWKRWGGLATRLTAMLAVAVAGVLPVLAKIFGESGKFAIDAAWATVLLMVAALLVSLDYFLGLTSGWVRYLVTQQKIARAIFEFEFEWETLRSTWAGRELTPDQCHAALNRLKATLLQVQQIVEDETAQWATEFQKTIQRLDEAARAKAEVVVEPGATITVSNGEGIGEWTLAVDDGTPVGRSGMRRALVGLRPGLHKFVAEAHVDGRTVRDEITAEVLPTGVTEITLTLR